MTREKRHWIGALLMAIGFLMAQLGLAISLLGIFWQLKYMSGESACRPTWSWYECPGSIDKPTAVKP